MYYTLFFAVNSKREFIYVDSIGDYPQKLQRLISMPEYLNHETSEIKWGEIEDEIDVPGLYKAELELNEVLDPKIGETYELRVKSYMSLFKLNYHLETFFTLTTKNDLKGGTKKCQNLKLHTKIRQENL